MDIENKAAAPLAAGGGRSMDALFVHLHFGKAENIAGTIKFMSLFIQTALLIKKQHFVILSGATGEVEES